MQSQKKYFSSIVTNIVSYKVPNFLLGLPEVATLWPHNLFGKFVELLFYVRFSLG